MISALKIFSDTTAYIFSICVSVLFYSTSFKYAVENINYLLIVGGGVFFIVSIYNYNGYDKTIEFSQLREITALIRASMIMLIVSIVGLFIFQISVPDFITISSIIMFIVSLIVFPIVFRKISMIIYSGNIEKDKVLLIGLGQMGKSFIDHIKSHHSGFSIISVLDDKVGEGFRYNGNYVYGGINKLDSFLENNHVDRIILSIRNLSEEKISFIQSKAAAAKTRLSYLPSIESFENNTTKLKDYAGIQLITNTNNSQSFFYKSSKRFIDIASALLIFVLSSPIWLLLPLIIKNDSPGPVLFKHKRVGLNGKQFELYKFRSMYIDTPKYAHCPTGVDDPRITKVGRWMRKISLDELPQLINILKGEMSMVGPRPEMPFIVDEYNNIENRRLIVKPGLTGLWQVSPHRNSEIHHNLEYDFYYIENQGLVLDFVIMIMTIFFTIRGITH